MTRYHQIAVETLTTIVLLNIILQLKKVGQNFRRSAIEIKKVNVFYKRIQNSKNSQKKNLTNTSVKLRKEEKHQIKSN